MISWCSLQCRLEIHHTTNVNLNQNMRVTRWYLFYSVVKITGWLACLQENKPEKRFSGLTCVMFTCHSWHRIAGRALCWVTRNQQHREFHFFVTTFRLKILLYLVSSRICPVRSQRKPDKREHNYKLHSVPPEKYCSLRKSQSSEAHSVENS